MVICKLVNIFAHLWNMIENKSRKPVEIDTKTDPFHTACQ